MPKTVKAAFDVFRADVVDLEPGQVATARSSRDYLLDQLKALASSGTSFPPYTGGREFFGSFARKTKIRPLDDIDLMAMLNGSGLTATQGVSAMRLQVTGSTAPLAPWADSGYINSRRVLNATKSGLVGLSSYSKADLHTNLQAVTLQLTSYTWNFDIVASVRVGDGNDGTAYFLIPNGQGEWMKSDPRKAQDRVTAINQAHNNEFLPAMRLLKWWKRKKGFGSIGSFAFEVFASQVFGAMSAHGAVHLAFGCFFSKAPNYVFSQWTDPAGFSGDLGASIPSDTKLRLHQELQSATSVANQAYQEELAGKQEDAIKRWRAYLGNDFPAYG